MQNPRRTELSRGQRQSPWLQSSVESVQSVVYLLSSVLLYLAKPVADLLNSIPDGFDRKINLMRCHTEGQH